MNKKIKRSTAAGLALSVGLSIPGVSTYAGVQMHTYNIIIRNADNVSLLSTEATEVIAQQYGIDLMTLRKSQNALDAVQAELDKLVASIIVASDFSKATLINKAGVTDGAVEPDPASTATTDIGKLEEALATDLLGKVGTKADTLPSGTPATIIEKLLAAGHDVLLGKEIGVIVTIGAADGNTESKQDDNTTLAPYAIEIQLTMNLEAGGPTLTTHSYPVSKKDMIFVVDPDLGNITFAVAEGKEYEYAIAPADAKVGDVVAFNKITTNSKMAKILYSKLKAFAGEKTLVFREKDAASPSEATDYVNETHATKAIEDITYTMGEPTYATGETVYTAEDIVIDDLASTVEDTVMGIIAKTDQLKPVRIVDLVVEFDFEEEKAFVSIPGGAANGKVLTDGTNDLVAKYGTGAAGSATTTTL
ncbi:hypothetical protein [Candidatus Epulonipiscium viviparus]|uniref:hypothetical protein n=1 Tax=Candidatus Epulonipiscium viviparus TaxID=420336 RepID=UPI00273806B6|nr:hypothetical protein [Candidatus Epulopiscium viviparus]